MIRSPFLFLLLIPCAVQARGQCLEEVLPAPPLTAHDGFGAALVTSGERLLVSMAGDGTLGHESGSVRLYTPNALGDWVVERVLYSPYPGPGHSFGISADLLGDLCVVGAQGEDFSAGPGLGGEYLSGTLKGPDTGAAYVFERLNGVWEPAGRLQSNDPGAYQYFGSEVALAVDSILVSEPARGHALGTGVVTHFIRGAGGWVDAQNLQASVAGTLAFGHRMARDGNTLLVAGSGNPTEKVFIFERGASGWVETANFIHPYSPLSNRFGWSLDVEGDTAVIGAFLEDEAGPSQSGAVYLVERVAGTWSITQTIVAPDASTEDAFGYELDLRGDWLAVGARGVGAGAENFRGAVYRFRRTPNGFVFSDMWSPASGGNTGFGSALALTGAEAFVSGTFQFAAGFGSGRVTRIPYPANAASYCSCASGSGCGNSDGLAGCANSLNVGSTLRPCGSTSVSLDDLTLGADSLPASQAAYLFMGGAPAALPLGDGMRCVAAGGAGLYRFPPQSTGGGSLTHGPGLVATSTSLFGPAGSLSAGSTWYFQTWYRDPGGPCGSGSNLTDAVAVTFGP